MPPATYQPLVSGHVYRLGEQLLEAHALGDIWRLYLLDERGAYVAEAQGRLMAYELRTDGSGLWDKLHYAQIAAIWPAWAFLRGGQVEVDQAHLCFVAESRQVVTELWQLEDERFFELMAEFSWNKED